MKSKFKNITPTQIIILGFLVTIAIGTVILMLPISNNKPIRIVEALFTVVSSTCVTGLTTVPISEQFTTFGKTIIMLLIEIGGLGFMVFVSLILMIFGKKISLKERILISQSLNQNSLKGMVKLTRTIFKYTLIFEIIGALLLATTFVPMYGWGKGLFMSLFHSVSSFCNAGIDIIPGNDSLAMLREVPVVNYTISILTIVGGIGFFVWSDIEEAVSRGFKQKCSVRKIVSSLSLHTKMVLIITIILLIVGTFSFYLLEKDNTLSHLDIQDKWMASFFQTVEVRTSGMSTIDAGKMLNATKVLMMVLMLIGGAPGSTAGGIKIVTVGVIIMAIIKSIKGKKHLTIFKKEIPDETVSRAHVLFEIAIVIVVLSTTLLMISDNNFSAIDLTFECITAYATAGLSTGITPMLSLFGKWLLMLLMFIGRVGTISMAVLFVIEKPKTEDYVRYATENVMIG